LFQKKPAKILFEIALDRIKGIAIDKKKYLKEKEETVILLLENGQSDSDVALLRTEETRALKRRIEEIVKNL